MPAADRAVPLQRFRCFGDLDAPDWILAEISVLAKVSSVRMKLIVSQVINSIKGQAMDYAKVAKLTADAGLQTSEVKAAVAALQHILQSAAKYNCDDGVLENELQQLGLPKEHTVSLCRPYKDHRDSMRQILAEQTFHLNGLDAPPKWRAEINLGSSECAGTRSVSGHLLLPTGGQEVAFEISQDKLAVLHRELLAARSIMESLQ
eukprot:Tamp_31523.p1 GENE.Tamp_31523~~Tamp_31523.p1  ORF type:complete len:205 (-),score=48.90 Tamp_31523:63-677(-)